MASTISCTFLVKDFSGVSSWIFTSCCVMVLPPSLNERDVRSTQAARAVEEGSMAPW